MSERVHSKEAGPGLNHLNPFERFFYRYRHRQFGALLADIPQDTKLRGKDKIIEVSSESSEAGRKVSIFCHDLHGKVAVRTDLVVTPGQHPEELVGLNVTRTDFVKDESKYYSSYIHPSMNTLSAGQVARDLRSGAELYNGPTEG
jgi:hypothetical protein